MELRQVMVTGGAGFIGSNFVRLLIERGVPRVVVYDKLTYAGNRLNLSDPRARKYLAAQMEGYFFGEGAEQPAGYVPPSH